MKKTNANVLAPLSPKQMQRLLMYWVGLLRLGDWDLDVRFNVRTCDMDMENTTGCTRMLLSQKEAVIKLLDPKHYPDDRAPWDMENTLVHELLHCHFAVAERCANLHNRNDEVAHMLAIEAPIAAISAALVNARRDFVPFEWESLPRRR